MGLLSIRIGTPEVVLLWYYFLLATLIASNSWFVYEVNDEYSKCRDLKSNATDTEAVVCKGTTYDHILANLLVFAITQLVVNGLFILSMAVDILECCTQMMWKSLILIIPAYTSAMAIALIGFGNDIADDVAKSIKFTSDDDNLMRISGFFSFGLQIIIVFVSIYSPTDRKPKLIPMYERTN